MKKISLEVYCRKNGFSRIFLTSFHIEKKLSRIVQLTSLRKRTHVVSELFFFYVELLAETINPQLGHTPYATSKINFSEKLYIGQKILHESFEIYEQGRFWPFSVCCFKIYSEFLLLGYLVRYLPPPKNKVNAAQLIYIKSVCKIDILSENKSSLVYINKVIKLFSEIIWADFQNWVRICLWSESGFRSEFVFGPNCRRAHPNYCFEKKSLNSVLKIGKLEIWWENF